MNTKALKQKILDLAIHGKLLPLAKVEKIRKEDPASILLEKIRVEKEAKIAKGELKKDKKDSFIFLGDDKRHYEKFADGSIKDIEDEIPFDIPDNWQWCRLGEICELNPKNKLDDSLEVSFIPMNLIEAEYSNKHGQEKRKWKDIKKGFTHFSENDVAVAKISPCFENRKSVILKNLINGFGAGTTELFILRPDKNLLSEYLLWIIKTNSFINTGVGNFSGVVGQQRLQRDIVEDYFLPLPPLAEQQLIVSEIEKIFAQIDLLEQNKTDLQTAIKQAKSKILDLAIHAKLAHQDPNDEPASILLEKIRTEKEAKIAKGKLKKDKKDSFIFLGDDKRHYEKFADGSIKDIEDEIPFDIPDNWQWCRLGEICYFQNGYAFQSNKFSKDGKTIIIRISDIKDGYINLNDCVLSQETEIDKSYIVNNGDLLIAMSGATTGKNGIYNSDRIAYLNQRVGNIKIRDMQTMIPSYRNYYIQAMQEEILKQAYGGAQPNISSTKLNDMFLPLPPFAEQQRIVSKIEEIFAILDRISNELGVDI
ncbi:restriction endonuclease subunit S [Campylobacter lanienae]|uniref:restriction endonuclease subunit S n=1 Tax=Campylobacter lanienae TaxID=75658 RepID=UPI002A91E2D9|nr:restriction endonuclease subunit S [Campylobacter lanienae]MDY6135165.1 restriction endonuclease subunit S [Campylobacter lanienae]